MLLNTAQKFSKRPTPFLLYDLNIIEQNYSSIKKAFPTAQIFYAVKANKLNPVLAKLASLGCNFEVNNKCELGAVNKIGAISANTLNSSPIKSPQVIKQMFKMGVSKFAYDCKEEVDKIAKIAPKSKLYLRIHTSNKGSGQHLNTKFGAHFEDAEELINYAVGKKMAVFGITFSVGSQCLNLENWKEGIEKTARLFDKFPFLNTLDIGGGIPIKYQGKTLAVDEIAKIVIKTIKDSFEREPQLIVEPGRFLTGNSAVTVATVIGIKENSFVNWAFVDVSIFGGFLELFEFKKGFKYPIATNKEGRLMTYSIAGPTCDGCDIIAKKVRLPRLSLGDRIYFLNTGAYTLEYSSPFNGFPIPKVFFTGDTPKTEFKCL